MDMTRAELRATCKKLNLYGTAYLNDKLYLHYRVRAVARARCCLAGGRGCKLERVRSRRTCPTAVARRRARRLAGGRPWRPFCVLCCVECVGVQGFRRIENLEEFTGLKVRAPRRYRAFETAMCFASWLGPAARAGACACTSLAC